jgi:LmbE family N-acetylglucosaminyl deacetylase
MATALFFAPHQDDELISMSTDIIDHLNTGHDVHVIVCMNGAGSCVKDALRNGKTNCNECKSQHKYGFSPTEFTKSRDNEFRDSCLALGVKSANTHYYSDRGDDGSLTKAKAITIINYYLNQYPRAKVKTISPYGGNIQVNDHRVLGEAAQEIYKSGKINDLRLFVEPYLISDFTPPAGSGISPWIVTSDSTGNAKINKALDAYSTWRPNASPTNSDYTSVNTAVGDPLNFRSGPGTSYGTVFSLERSKPVDILERNTNGWVRGKTEKGTGWCNSAYLLKTIVYSDSARYAIGYHSVPEALNDFRASKKNYCHAPYNG